MARRVPDLVGQQFGTLTVLAPAGHRHVSRQALVRCRCVCGREVVVYRTGLRRGKTRTCGASVHRQRANRFLGQEADCHRVLRALRRWTLQQWIRDGQRYDLEEYVDIAHTALLGILERFEPAHGIPLSVYARPRLKGAIRDAWEQVQCRRVLAPKISWQLGYGRPDVRALHPSARPAPREPSAEMQRYLALLPRPDRALVWLWACGATPAAIALRLRYPSGQAVSNRLHYLMTKLRKEPCIQAAYAALR